MLSWQRKAHWSGSLECVTTNFNGRVVCRRVAIDRVKIEEDTLTASATYPTYRVEHLYELISGRKNHWEPQHSSVNGNSAKARAGAAAPHTVFDDISSRIYTKLKLSFVRYGKRTHKTHPAVSINALGWFWIIVEMTKQHTARCWRLLPNLTGSDARQGRRQ